MAAWIHRGAQRQRKIQVGKHPGLGGWVPEKPYNSKNSPLQVLFGSRSQVGAPVPDWSMVLSIGMGKSSAARMILEAVSEMNLDIADIRSIAPKLKALLRMRCTYDPAQTEEEQLEKAFADKTRETERPRPLPTLDG